MKNRSLMMLLLLAGSLGLAGCSATDIGAATEAGMIIAGEDPEKARTVSQGVTGVAGSLQEMPFETERTIGDGIALRSFTTQGRLHPSDALQRYVNLVGKTLTPHTTRAELPYVFAVVENDEVNAWAGPGGYVFITTGALMRMEDEAMLAGVLAHEIAHITQRHMVTMIRRQEGLASALDALSPTSKDVRAYGGLLTNGEEILFKNGFDRKMEFEADRLGTEVAALAGYDPTGLRRYLAQFSTESTGGGWLSSTHPKIDARLQALDVVLAGEVGQLSGPALPERFRKNVLNELGK